jgi:hypothetical protein
MSQNGCRNVVERADGVGCAKLNGFFRHAEDVGKQVAN